MSTRPPRAAAREYPDSGAQLRAARPGRRRTLRELAKRLEVSPSLISQIETGRAASCEHALFDCRRAERLLDDLLFIYRRRGAVNGLQGWRATAAPASVPGGPVQRAAGRKKDPPRFGSRMGERLTTRSEIGAEFLHVAIGFDDYELNSGDSVSLESSNPHRLYNVGSKPIHATWFVLGPLGVDAAAPSMHRDPHNA